MKKDERNALLEQFTEEEIELFEAETQTIGYRRAVRINLQSITREYATGLPTSISLKRAEKFVKQRVDWLLQNDIEKIQRGKDDIFNITQR